MYEPLRLTATPRRGDYTSRLPRVKTRRPRVVSQFEFPGLLNTSGFQPKYEYRNSFPSSRLVSLARMRNWVPSA